MLNEVRHILLKNSLILFLTISFLITGYARAAVKSAEKMPLPREKPGVVDARASVHYLMGLIYDKRGEFEEAIKEYREALRFDPHSPSIIAQLIKDYTWLGQMYQRQGKLKEAVKQYEALLKFHSGDPDKNIAFRFFLAAIYERAGQLKEAGANLEKVITLNPKAIEAYLQLGRLYLKRDLTKEGIGILEKGRELALRDSNLYLLPRSNPGNNRKEVLQGIYFLLGLAYSREENYDKAVSRQREYLSMDPDNALVRFYMGANLERQGKTEEAILELKKAIELNPKNYEALNYLGYLYAEQGINLDESIKLIKRALEMSPDSNYIVDSLGWAYFKEGKLDEALKELKRAVELSLGRNKDDAVIRDHLGDAYFKKGMVKEATRQWKKSLELNPQNDKVREKLKRASRKHQNDKL